MSVLVMVCGSHPAMAAPQTVSAALSGVQETPSNASAATGTCTVTADATTATVSFSGRFSGLSAAATVAAIHGPAGLGQTAPILLQTAPSPSTAATFSGAGTLTASQVVDVLTGQAYCEISDTAFATGELRGQLGAPSATPALPPMALLAMALALAGASIGLLQSRARPA